MIPNSLLEAKSRYFSCARLLIDAGTVPLSWLPLKFSWIRVTHTHTHTHTHARIHAYTHRKAQSDAAACCIAAFGDIIHSAAVKRIETPAAVFPRSRTQPS